MKFHSSDLKSRIKSDLRTFHDIVTIIFSIFMLFFVAIIFSPVRLISRGVIKKVTEPIMDIQFKLSSHYFSKMIFTMYTM